ncbi:AidA/PixA family protein [Flavobacterium pectinovorum]|uniref:Inclusion body protein n=1 Tax=Flavobacterium pectinovorum TaxID=29533 RepID=A0A502ESE7_9FLAO|nr:AidA/PixA family protein [Flavobacterium pectinovorum]TPG39982.1 hypothetical protein EAH81_11825 [Flavobacterium pectinovorum]
METPLSVTQQVIYEILIVIDTNSIKNKWLMNDINEPIKIDKENWFTIYRKNNEDNSVHEISIDSKRNDKIIISGISIDGGSSDSIILNKIQNYKSIKKNIVSFKPICESKNKIFNNEEEGNELSVSNEKQNFIWFESVISDFGKSKIKISFSLYYLNSDGNQQDLYGQFWFPLEIKFYKADK